MTKKADGAMALFVRITLIDQLFSSFSRKRESTAFSFAAMDSRLRGNDGEI